MKMKNLKIVLGVSILSIFVLTSCQNKTEEPAVTAHEEQMSDMMQPSQTMAYNVGDKVPNKQVCMVNNAYKRKKDRCFGSSR